MRSLISSFAHQVSLGAGLALFFGLAGTASAQVPPAASGYFFTQPDAITGDNVRQSFTRQGVNCTNCLLPDANGVVDIYTQDIYERPTQSGSSASVYFPALDITSGQVAYDADYLYYRINLYGIDTTGKPLPYFYAFEINFDNDARGDLLVRAEDPSGKIGSNIWGSIGVVAFADQNNNIGSGQLTQPDGPGNTASGYETKVFDQGSNLLSGQPGGNNAVVARVVPAGADGRPALELAVKRSFLTTLNGNNPVVKAGFRSYASKAGSGTTEANFYLHDNYGRLSAGSPFPWLTKVGALVCPNTLLAETALTLLERESLDSGTNTNTGIFNPCYPSGGNIVEFDNGGTVNDLANAAGIQFLVDLAVTKIDTPDPVIVGNNLTYTLTVTNNTSGSGQASGVKLTDTLPAGVTFVSATPSQGSCTQASGIVTCNLGNLSNSANATVTIVVKPTAAGTITNTASVTSNETESNTANNTANAPTIVNLPIISGTLYQDTDGSNAFETGEPRLPAGITVTLYNDADNDNVIDTGEQVGSPVTTDANGNYTFTGTGNGTYKIRVDTADSDIPTGLLLGTANNLVVPVNNASVLNQNFGFDPPATLPAGSSNFCAVPYPEVYIGTATNSILAIHTDTGAAILLTNSALAAANSLATDHNNRLVYYANANSLYAYDVINNTHITITNNFSSFLPSGYTFSTTSLNGGGAAFYNGSLYIGIDTNVTSDILRVNFSADGRTIQRVTPLYLNARGLAANADWGDFIIGNNGILYGSAVNEGQFWSLDLNSSSSQIININAGTTLFQLAKTGDGKFWAFSGTPANVQQIDPTGSLLGTSKATTAGAAAEDAAECVRGQATVGDRVWNDSNGNGLEDAAEAGIAGVMIEIYRDINKDGTLDAGEPLLGTKTTDANGNYTFPDLLPHDRLTGTGRNDFIVRVSGGVPAGATATTPTTLAVDLSTATQIYSTADFGYRSGSAQLLLVKRITRINGNTSNGVVNLTQVVDDPNTTDDNNSNWPANYLVGAINGGIVRPGDELEYTVYFLSSGAIPVKNVSVCDLVPVSTTFVPTAFTSNSGITLAIGSTTPVFLTNASDTDGGQFIVAGTETPGSCNKAAFSNPTPPPLPAAQNLAGAVVVDVVTGSTTFPANTTGSSAYGFIRLRAKVK